MSEAAAILLKKDMWTNTIAAGKCAGCRLADPQLPTEAARRGRLDTSKATFARAANRWLAQP